MIVPLPTVYWERISALVINAMLTFPYLECVFFISQKKKKYAFKTELEVTWLAISCDLFISANATVESQSNFNLQVSLV